MTTVLLSASVMVLVSINYALKQTLVMNLVEKLKIQKGGQIQSKRPDAKTR